MTCNEHFDVNFYNAIPDSRLYNDYIDTQYTSDCTKQYSSSPQYDFLTNSEFTDIPLYSIGASLTRYNQYSPGWDASMYHYDNDSNHAFHSDMYSNTGGEIQQFSLQQDPNSEGDNSIEVPMQLNQQHIYQQQTVQVPVTSSQLPSFINTFSNIVGLCNESPPIRDSRKETSSRRGRPPTYYKHGYNFVESDSGVETDEDRRSPNSPTVMRCRKGAKNILLWKFLLEELRKPGAQHIKWVAEREGVFKFVDTAETSRLWGNKKKKEDMNFEKLSRGIRHYYRDGLMSRVDGTRLVYQFNWSRVPRAYRWRG